MDLSRGRLLTFVAAGAVLAVLLLVALFVRDGAAPQPTAFTTAVVRWQAPQTGAVPVRYAIRIRDVRAATEDTFSVAAVAGEKQSFTFARARAGREYQACIAGVDAQDRQGPWSGWSSVHRSGSDQPAP